MYHLRFSQGDFVIKFVHPSFGSK